jgi:hypothetical protein
LLQLDVDAGSAITEAQQQRGRELVSIKDKPLGKRALTALAEPNRLLRKLLLVLNRSKAAPASLPPAGTRSGEGARSLAPYLEEARNSKPGDLE